jgi:hypothetical protein
MVHSQMRTLTFSLDARPSRNCGWSSCGRAGPAPFAVEDQFCAYGGQIIGEHFRTCHLVLSVPPLTLISTSGRIHGEFLRLHHRPPPHSPLVSSARRYRGKFLAHACRPWSRCGLRGCAARASSSPQHALPPCSASAIKNRACAACSPRGGGRGSGV